LTEVVSPKRLVLFDLDGVLLDSRENMRLSWAAVCDELGIGVPFARYFAEIGLPFREIMARLALSDAAEEIETVYRVASMKNLAAVAFFPGTEEALRELVAAGIKLGVVTSKDERRTNAILAMLPVDFETVRTPNGHLRGKPAPDHLLMAMAETGVDPAETIYVGDMIADYEAARRAGIDYAHAAWGYGPRPDGCAIVLDDMAHTARRLLPAAGRRP
jgi:HAD superfamily hydrolase (TIGR01549 family)